jgi:predicted nuclease of restriction endonuclease-like (RecB) superfamily
MLTRGIDQWNKFCEVLDIIRHGKQTFTRQANTILIDTYWHVGAYLCEKVAAESWGKGVVKELAAWLVEQDPEIKGFSAQNLWRMKQFYELYKTDKKLSTLLREISWSHHMLLIGQCKTPEERLFYALRCRENRWSVRDLQGQIKSGSFERTMLANTKLPPAIKKLPQDVTGIFKDSYLIDFADLSEPHCEKDLQRALVANLRAFLLELGDGFTFVGEKVRLQVGMRDFELDLLFFHRDLQCLVAFELKTVPFEPEHLGKLSFYLETLDEQNKRPHENPSIGVLLCRSKDDEVVEYALRSTLSPALVAEYETKLVSRKVLRQKMNEWYRLLEGGCDE